MTETIAVASENPFASEHWFDPLETAVRHRIREFIETLLEAELSAALGRDRYQRGSSKGYRNGHRDRQLIGTFGTMTVSVPRARVSDAAGKTEEWHSKTARRCRPTSGVTRQAEALIASSYLAGTNTRSPASPWALAHPIAEPAA
jgi:putative transposase